MLLKVVTPGNAAAGPTGEADVGGIYPHDWRACTIVLRAATTGIPTLSEWGLGVFVALTGIAAIWALRRRDQRA